MIAVGAATLAICAASLLVGQAAVALCGCRHWSWLSPAVGLALVSALCWATVRMPGDGLVSAIAVLVAVLGALVFLARGGVEWDGEWRLGLPVALAALLAASLPFLAEGHTGILGTGFNPDMSQHLLASDRLADGHGSGLLAQGYPLGPHAIVVALGKGLGIGLVQGFDGLTVAVAVLAPLTALAAFQGERLLPRIAAALVAGLTYMVASYYAQGAFKETMQAFFVLAFVISLREVARSPDWRHAPLRFVPAALIAVGSVYAYSYPGLTWLVGAAVVWVAIEMLVGRPPATGPGALRAGLLALLAFSVLVLPELGRMIEFHNFETFDPDGPGLGNLFGQISPAEALGIWPSGDFRLTPGAGAIPALGYYVGACFAGILFVYGIVLCRGRREHALLAGVVAVGTIYLAARVGGTPYTEAKAIVIASPVLALTILIPLVRRPAGWLYMLAAGGCALLAFANAPVGPSSYSPALTGLRPAIAEGSTLYLASDRLLDEEHGERFVVWELRGGRVCVGRRSEAGGRPPQGVRFVIAERSADEEAAGVGEESRARPPFSGLRLRRVADPYVLWEAPTPPRGNPPCPLIAVRQARAAD